MTTRREALGWIVGGAATLVLPAAGAEPARERSALEDVAGLETPVTIAEAKIPLGELVARIAAETGVSLRAAREVADEPVALVVREMPARELLEEFAHLLDYRWSRRGREGAWRYEIWQDLAARRREAALKDARRAAVEKRFREKLSDFSEAAALSETEILALQERVERHQRDLARRREEEQLAPLPPQMENDLRLYSAAHHLRWPVPKALAGMLATLPRERWERLWRRERLAFSTEPQAGELRLPEATARALRAASPAMLAPGVTFRGSHPDTEQIVRKQDEERKKRWTAAAGYRVVLRVSGDAFRSQGSLSLTASAAPFYVDPERGSSFAPDDRATSVQITVEAVEAQRDEEFTAERWAALAKDPVVGAVKPFKPKPEALVKLPGPQNLTAVRFPNLVPDLARTYGVQFLSDAYWLDWPRLIPRVLPDEPAPLYRLLDSLSAGVQRWERRGDRILLRSRTWFYDRPREIPLRHVRRWREQIESQGSLPLEEYLTIARDLTDSQLETLREPVLVDMGLPGDLFGGLSFSRHALRLYASLLPRERQALDAGQALPTARMSRAQRELYLAGLREFHPYEPWEPEPEKIAAGGFSVAREEALRLPERRLARRRPDVAASPPSVPPGRPVTHLRFRFLYGEELREAGAITLPRSE
jgi:hypothetical protein